jgi:hypothetical protein
VRLRVYVTTISLSLMIISLSIIVLLPIGVLRACGGFHFSAIESTSYARQLVRHAVTLIRSGISDSQLPHVRGCTTAHLVWTRICSAHEKQGLNHALSFFHIVVTTKLEEGGRVLEHINTIRTAYERLVAAEVDMSIPDPALAAILLYSFPSSYEPIKMTLSALKKEDFTFSAVSRAMLNEEQRRITSASLPTSPSGGSEQSALAAYRKQVPCNWCGLDNHSERDCHRKKRGEPQRTAAERQEVLDNFHQRRYRGRSGRTSPSNKEANFAELSDDNVF